MSTTNNKEIQLLYEKYGFMIYGRCLKILGSSEDARDAMQVVFIKLLRKYDTIKNKSLVVPWIFKVAQNHCFNVLRKSKKFNDSVKTDDVVHIDDFDDQMSKRQILLLIMGRVNRKIRDVVHYTFIEDLNQREITKLTGQSPATIRRNLQKFRKFLPAARRELGL